MPSRQGESLVMPNRQGKSLVMALCNKLYSARMTKNKQRENEILEVMLHYSACTVGSMTDKEVIELLDEAWDRLVNV